MKLYFQKRKASITRFLNSFLSARGLSLSEVHQQGRQVCDAINSFSRRGKMIRGGLVSLGYGLYRGENGEARDIEILDRAGAAIELFQSALLIHDDIMDNDTIRRGEETLFYQYARQAERGGAKNSYHLGESLGICAGDIAIFLAFELLADMKTDPSVSVAITRLFAREMEKVGVAQMLDVYWGEAGRWGNPNVPSGAVPASGVRTMTTHGKTRADEKAEPDMLQHPGASAAPNPDLAESRITAEDILKLYIYKTGRYTFSLPLSAGALLAGRNGEERDVLERIGELLGTVFQIRDDELGIYGTEAELGKPLGSDVAEGKKTLFFYHLTERLSPGEVKRFSALYGAGKVLDADELDFIRELGEETGVRALMGETCGYMADEAKDLIDSLVSVDESYRDLLSQLLIYNLTRVS